MSDRPAPVSPRLRRVLPWAVLALVLPALGLQLWQLRPVPERPDRAVAAETEPAEHEYTNALIDSNSPYLRMHAHNPVDWHPWGEEAFEEARRENKPIFLSVGYSTCYWCQVMERESFEDEQVAELLNEHYVAVKVDREQRPDIDEQYMLATQLLTRRGGWPNSVWLTPEGKPWMAGTYFPKPHFMQILARLAEVWEEQESQVREQADQIAEAIARVGAAGGRGAGPDAGAGAELNPGLVAEAVEQIVENFDPRRGGFPGEPKFPPHGALRLLAHEHRKRGDPRALETLATTLDAMWLGGMHDHVGGGFHRYATDREWLLPHFEKMLYDNAQLMYAYAEGHALTGRERYRRAVEDIHRWLGRKMTGEHGAFYSAINSEVDGEEGKSYVWHIEEVVEVLGEEDGEVFAEVYHIEKHGNYREEATGEKPGTNIPHLDRPLAEIARERGVEPARFRERLAAMREKLLAQRQTWPQPHIDDKVLAGWNGLMIEALAHAGRVLDEPRYTASAGRAAGFILDEMVRDGRLMRVYRAGQVSQPAYLDDHAYLAAGLIELYRATGHPRWLNEARQLADAMLKWFQDEQAGGFFFTSEAHEDLLMRSKNLTGGGNVPTPNGVATHVMLNLGELTGRPRYVQAARRTLKSLAGVMRRTPLSTEWLLIATSDHFSRTEQEQEGEEVSAVAGARASEGAEPDASRHGSPVSVRVFASSRSVRPGDALALRVVLDIAEGWHLYGSNPEIDFLVPSTVSVSAKSGEIEVGEVKAPEPHRIQDPILKQEVNTHTGRIEYTVPVTVPEDAAPGEMTLVIEAHTQACDDSRCLPPRTHELELPITVAAGGW